MQKVKWADLRVGGGKTILKKSSEPMQQETLGNGLREYCFGEENSLSPTEFWGKLSEFYEKLGEFGLAHK